MTECNAPLHDSEPCESLVREDTVLVIGGVAQSLDSLKPDTQEH